MPQQHPQNALTAPLHSYMQDAPVVTIPQVQIRAPGFQEHLHHRFVPAQDGPVQRRATERVGSIDAGAVGEEQRGYG